MSSLPSRKSFKRTNVTLMEAKPILTAYVRGELVSRQAVLDFLVAIGRFGADPVVAFASAFQQETPNE